MTAHDINRELDNVARTPKAALACGNTTDGKSSIISIFCTWNRRQVICLSAKEIVIDDKSNVISSSGMCVWRQVKRYEQLWSFD